MGVMNSKERVINQILGKEVDHVPLMGGWFHGVANLASIAGVSTDDYLQDPLAGLLGANRNLGVDCMIKPIVPDRLDQIRTGESLDESFEGVEPETLKEIGDRVPDTRDKILGAFDVHAVEAAYRHYFEEWMAVLGDLVLIPNFWEAVPDFHLYSKYGYHAYLGATALYPEAVGRMFWKDATEARARNEILVRLIAEYDLPPMLFTGGDVCNNRGPMCTPRFLRKHYFPEAAYALEPLFDAGIRVVRHCDGNVMPLIDDFVELGYSGFQGFQYECGVDPWQFSQRKSIFGRRLLFFAGLNVTRTLPYGSTDDVRAEIDYVMDYTEGGQGLFFFTSSSIGPEVPCENIVFAHEYVASGQYLRDRGADRWTLWPGLEIGSVEGAKGTSVHSH